MALFNKEDLIKWNDLATSLQDIIMRKITWDMLHPDLQNWLLDKEKRIMDLEDWRKKVEKWMDEVNDRLIALETGGIKFTDVSQGQFAKIDIKNKNFYGHDGFVSCRVVKDDAELASEMGYGPPISLKDVFNTWTRYAHFHPSSIKDIIDRTDFGAPSGQNLPGFPFTNYTNPANGGWTLGTKNGMTTIFAHGNLDPVAGFINPTDFYTNYYLRVLCDTGWDEDNIFIVIGYTRDSAGVEHTLSLVRGAGYVDVGWGKGAGHLPLVPPAWQSINDDIDTVFWWGLIYDFGNPTQVILNDLSAVVGPSPFPTDPVRSCQCYITAIRSDDQFEFRTTQWSTDGSNKDDIKNATFTFKLPDFKPTSWSQDMYDNIYRMLKVENRIGFGVRSGEPSFSIYEQRYIFDDGDIYALHQNKVYTYDHSSSSWVVKGRMNDLVSNCIFMYNPRLETFYFYKFWNNFTQIFAL